MGLFSASVEFSEIEALPIFATRQFLPFIQVDSMKKPQIDVVDPGDVSDDYINNLQSFEPINILACTSQGLGKITTKTAKLGIERPYREVMESILFSAQESQFIEMTVTFDQPAAVGRDYLKELK